MPSTQKKIFSDMEIIEEPTTTTIIGPGGRAIQVTGTKVTIPATWSPSGRPRQPTTTTTTTQPDDAPSSSAPSSSATTSRKPANTGTGTGTGTSTCGTPCHHQWQPSLSPSQVRQSRESLRSMPASTRRLLDEAARWVPDCAKPSKGLIPTPEQNWCPVCCKGQTPPPWAEAPKPKAKPKGKEEEREVDEYDEDDEEYDWRRDDDWTDVWYDDT